MHAYSILDPAVSDAVELPNVGNDLGIIPSNLVQCHGDFAPQFEAIYDLQPQDENNVPVHVDSVANGK